MGEEATGAALSPSRSPSDSAGRGPAKAPAAIVLGLGVTGLGTVRALRAGGVDVHGACLSAREPGRHSRQCRVTNVRVESDEALCEWLLGYARALGDRPVVFPTNDRLALLLSREHERLARVCRVWTNKLGDLEGLVDKRGLYALAESAGLAVPPTLTDPTAAEARDWCAHHPGPYLVKPAYVGRPDSAMSLKNQVLTTAGEVDGFLAARSGRGEGLMLQRILLGGDGAIFDCYGYCGRDGQPRVLASHRRIRQYPPDFGITCYGEIPAAPEPGGQARLFELTRRLLARVCYHGIFGVEWLQERANGELYLLDFNARPFYTIDHLRDCGLNLPLLAYRELCGEEAAAPLSVPSLDHRFWVDFWRDAASFNRKRKTDALGWGAWLSSLRRCRSFALWRADDPLPSISAIAQQAADLVQRATARRRHP
jgi:D-aspartate ligase